LNHGAEKTLTYSQLSEINRHRLTRDKEKPPNYEAFVFEEGFPSVYHTHHAYDGRAIKGYRYDIVDSFKQFDKLIYLIRNPYDTMISYFNFMMDRDIPFNGAYNKEFTKQISTLEGFTKHFLPIYLHHIKVTRPHADLVLDYDVLRKGSFMFFHLALDLITEDKTDLKVLNKSIEMSSFDNIKKMGIETKQEYGLASTYRGYFTRDGRSGQYKEVMSKELIEWIKNELKKEEINLW
jgi:hypothetical protein